MHEGDLQTEQPLPRLGVDQLGSGRPELGERRRDVVDLVGNVMQSGATFREKPADGGVIPERRKELDPVVAHPDGRGFDALRFDAGAVLEPSTEEPLIALHGLVEIRDGDADVVDASCVHGGDASVRDPR